MKTNFQKLAQQVHYLDTEIRQEWANICEAQAPLTKLVVQEVAKHGVDTTYAAECFEYYMQAPANATSVPVYALILFERLIQKFQNGAKSQKIPLEQALLHWFNAIPIEEIGNRLQGMSNAALKFTKLPGHIFSVVLAMCANLAYKMLEGYDNEISFKPYKLGALMFDNEEVAIAFKEQYDSDDAWSRWEEAKRDSAYDFKTFQVLVLNALNWNLNVTPEAYMTRVEHLSHVVIDPSRGQLHVRVRTRKQARSERLLAMLKGAAGPGPNNVLPPPTHPNRPVPDPSFWAALDAKQQRRKAQLPSRPLSPW